MAKLARRKSLVVICVVLPCTLLLWLFPSGCQSYRNLRKDLTGKGNSSPGIYFDPETGTFKNKVALTKSKPLADKHGNYFDQPDKQPSSSHSDKLGGQAGWGQRNSPGPQSPDNVEPTYQSFNNPEDVVFGKTPHAKGPLRYDYTIGGGEGQSHLESPGNRGSEDGHVPPTPKPTYDYTIGGKNPEEENGGESSPPGWENVYVFPSQVVPFATADVEASGEPDIVSEWGNSNPPTTVPKRQAQTIEYFATQSQGSRESEPENKPVSHPVQWRLNPLTATQQQKQREIYKKKISRFTEKETGAESVEDERRQVVADRYPVSHGEKFPHFPARDISQTNTYNDYNHATSGREEHKDRNGNKIGYHQGGTEKLLANKDEGRRDDSWDHKTQFFPSTKAADSTAVEQVYEVQKPTYQTQNRPYGSPVSLPQPPLGAHLATNDGKRRIPQQPENSAPQSYHDDSWGVKNIFHPPGQGGGSNLKIGPAASQRRRPSRPQSKGYANFKMHHVKGAAEEKAGDGRFGFPEFPFRPSEFLSQSRRNQDQPLVPPRTSIFQSIRNFALPF